MSALSSIWEASASYLAPALALIGLTITLTAVYLVGLVIYNLHFHPLAKYPGPRSFAATRIPYMRLVLSGRLPQAVKQLHLQYGDVVRLAPDELSFINGDAWKAIYGTRQGHGQKQKDHRFYPPTANGAPSIILSDDADHTRFRRALSHAFSENSLRGQEPIIKRYIDLLIQRLHENANGGETSLDMVAWYNFTTFDIIGDLAFGAPFDCLKNSEYHYWVSFIFNHIKSSAYTNVARRLPGSKYLFRLIAPKHVMEKKKLHFDITMEKVRGRVEKTNERPDFFSHVLKIKDTERAMSFGEMITNGSTLIIAGSETTATLLSGVTFLLLKNPRVLEKLQEEVRSAFQSDEEITFDACNRLKYINAVLTETFRVYPPVAPGLPRIVDAQGDNIAGHWVPGGTVVSISQLAAYNSPLNFTEPDKFIPERFLDDPRFENDSKMVMQPFSFGPRNCIGRNLANVEMRLILARVIFSFDMELDQRSMDWTDQNCWFLWAKPELMVKLKPRIIG